MEQQPNDGNWTRINNGYRFLNSKLGKQEGLMSNSHTHGNGLNYKIANVEKGETIEKETNSHTHDNGLNYKIANVKEKRLERR